MLCGSPNRSGVLEITIGTGVEGGVVAMNSDIGVAFPSPFGRAPAPAKTVLIVASTKE